MESNNLTRAQMERLVLVIEECSEIQHIASKILRHGWESYHPNDVTVSNRQLLEKELGDLAFVIHMLLKMKDVNEDNIGRYAEEKKDSIQKYLHYEENKQDD